MCQHENVTTMYSGGVRLSYGEYDDNVEEHLVCLDCGEVLEGEAVSSPTIPW